MKEPSAKKQVDGQQMDDPGSLRAKENPMQGAFVKNRAIRPQA